MKLRMVTNCRESPQSHGHVVSTSMQKKFCITAYMLHLWRAHMFTWSYDNSKILLFHKWLLALCMALHHGQTDLCGNHFTCALHRFRYLIKPASDQQLLYKTWPEFSHDFKCATPFSASLGWLTATYLVQYTIPLLANVWAKGRISELYSEKTPAHTTCWTPCRQASMQPK